MISDNKETCFNLSQHILPLFVVLFNNVRLCVSFVALNVLNKDNRKREKFQFYYYQVIPTIYTLKLT